MQDAAKKLRISYRHLKRLIKDGRIESKRRGRERIVSVKSIYRYLGVI